MLNKINKLGFIQFILVSFLLKKISMRFPCKNKFLTLFSDKIKNGGKC